MLNNFFCTCQKSKISTTQQPNFHPILATTTSATINQNINNPIPNFHPNLATTTTTSATVNQNYQQPNSPIAIPIAQSAHNNIMALSLPFYGKFKSFM